jgi:hypothetical protein
MKLYVGYTHEDRIPARQITNALGGRYTLIDPYSEITADDDLDERIRQFSRESDKILIVFSRNTVTMAFRDNLLPIIASTRGDLADSTVIITLDSTPVPKAFKDCVQLPIADLLSSIEPLHSVIEASPRETQRPKTGSANVTSANMPRRPAIAASPTEAQGDPALSIVESVRRIRSADTRVVQNYFRWDEATVNELKDCAARIKEGLSGKPRSPETFLFGGTSGSGKTFFVEQIAADIGGGVKFVPFDFSDMTLKAVRAKVKQVHETDRPVLVMIDEVDTGSAKREFYDHTFQLLEKNETNHPRTCVLLGSSIGGYKSVISTMKAKPPKCCDMATRITQQNCLDVPEPTLHDRIAIVAGQVQMNMHSTDPAVRRIEKLAAYYILSNSQLNTARALRKIMELTFERLEKRGATKGIMYNDLFDPGDVAEREFIVEHQMKLEMLKGRYIKFE